MIEVLKFGGTSLADVEAFNRCLEIICNGSSEKVVVVSASAGVTQSLVELGKGLTEEEQKNLLEKIRGIQNDIIGGLENPENPKPLIDGYLQEAAILSQKAAVSTNSKLKAELLSLGELMSSTLLVAYLKEKGFNSQFLDVREVLRTDDNHSQGEPQIDQISKLVNKKLIPPSANSITVTQGFIGSSDKGETTVLGRGGSDYSAALLAEALGANELQIWTDVCGIFSTDPRIESQAVPIPEISFNEAAEMATFGAKVLHPKTLWPAIRAKIPVLVGSSREPDEPGTRILPSSRKSNSLTAVALRSNQTLLTLRSYNMLQSYGFLAKVFDILANHKISVDLVTTSEVSVALTFDRLDEGKGISQELLNDLGELGEVKLDQNLALVAIIGSGMNHEAGVASWIFSELSDYNLRLICHGASQHNICFLVDQSSAEDVVKNIHAKIIEKSG